MTKQQSFTICRTTELKGEIDTSVIIIRDLKTPLSAIDKISTEKNSQVCRTEHYLKPTGSNDIYKNTSPKKNSIYPSFQLHKEHSSRQIIRGKRI